jgi:hypothetical protein
MVVGGQRHALASLLPGKTRYPFYRGLGGTLGRCGRVRKTSLPPGFDPRTVQTVAQSLYRLSYRAHKTLLWYLKNNGTRRTVLGNLN